MGSELKKLLKGSTGSTGSELAKKTFERTNGIRVSEKNLRKKGIKVINGIKVLDPVQKFRLKYNPGEGGYENSLGVCWDGERRTIKCHIL